MAENDEKDQEFEVKKIGEYETATSIVDGQIVVRIPESIANDPEAIKRFQEDIEKADREKLLPNIYANRSKLEKEKAALEARIAELEKNGSQRQPEVPANNGNAPVSTTIKPIHERLGLKSEDDLDDPDNYSPKAYRKAQEDYFNELSEIKAKQMLDNVVKNSQATAQQSILAARMVQEGNKPEEFQAWLKYQQNEGVPLQFNEGAYRLWKQAKADKSDPILAAQAFSQDMKIKFVAPGNVKPINFDNMTKADIDKMSPEQREAYQQYLIRMANR